MISDHLLHQLQVTIHFHFASFYETKHKKKKSKVKCLLNKLLNFNWGARAPWSYM